MLWHTFDVMSNVTPFPTPPASPPEPADPRVEQTLALVNTLIDSLPPQAKEHFLRTVAESLRPAIVPRAGEVLGTIVRFLSNRKDFTVAELRRQIIDEQGVNASPKAIYNAIGYLTRRQHIRRVGYGRYLIDGIPVVTADEVGGQPSITEGDLDD
jgi:hypothetical protein